MLSSRHSRRSSAAASLLLAVLLGIFAATPQRIDAQCVEAPRFVRTIEAVPVYLADGATEIMIPAGTRLLVTGRFEDEITVVYRAADFWISSACTEPAS